MLADHGPWAHGGVDTSAPPTLVRDLLAHLVHAFFKDAVGPLWYRRHRADDGQIFYAELALLFARPEYKYFMPHAFWPPSQRQPQGHHHMRLHQVYQIRLQS